MRAGVGYQVKAVTESATRGEIHITDSFSEGVSSLKGVVERVIRVRA